MTAQEERDVPLSQRRATTPPRWRLWLAAKYFGGLALLVGMIILVGAEYWLRGVRVRQNMEAMQTPPLQGKALVESKEALSGNHRVNPALTITFVVQGHPI